MDLNEESFPELLFTLQGIEIETGSRSQNTSLSLTDQEGRSSGQSSSSLVNEEKVNKEKGKLTQFKSKNVGQSKYSQKAQSCQDLHSNYTKKRYQHVKSKVREYIANIQTQDRRKQKITRHRSLPETLSGYSEFHSVSDDNKANEELFRKIVEQNYEEMTRLKALNDYLQENMQEKRAQVARLKRCSDSMRIELLQMKEKLRNSDRNTLSRYELECRFSIPRISSEMYAKSSKATQTCDLVGSDDTSQEECENFSTSSGKFGRKPTNSNSHKFQEISLRNFTQNLNSNGSDSAIESELNHDTSAKIDNGHPFNSVQKARKRKTINKKIWKSVFWSCNMTAPCCDKNDSLKDEYFYMRIPQTENKSSQQRLEENTYVI